MAGRHQFAELGKRRMGIGKVHFALGPRQGGRPLTPSANATDMHSSLLVGLTHEDLPRVTVSLLVDSLSVDQSRFHFPSIVVSFQLDRRASLWPFL
ncbi:hypothetical protein VE00_09569 [Pseudogymnoascus sp. WSF 3629]|nr:hypothetical protein VE00_09569 [Pseudogymnoascus sp. WSF 3629]